MARLMTSRIASDLIEVPLARSFIVTLPTPLKKYAQFQKLALNKASLSEPYIYQVLIELTRGLKTWLFLGILEY